MDNKYKNLLFIGFFVVFLVLPKNGQAQTAPGCGDSLLREYLFPISSYEEIGTPILRKGAECEQYAKLTDSTYSLCSALPTGSSDISKTEDSSISTSGTAKFSYKFTLTDRASYDFKITASNDNDNFSNLTDQQIDYILQNDDNNNHDQFSYLVRSSGTDRTLAITEYNNLSVETDVISPTQKYTLYKSLVFSVYLDGETAADRKGFIIINNTDPTDPQSGSVLLGNLAPGDHTVYLHFLNDFYFNFSGITDLPDFLSGFSNVDLNKNKILDNNPLINTASLNQITPAEDIVGIRVYCNSQNKDALTWYKDNVLNPSTSVQSIMVDGYKGIRDDRTVYVDAANLADNLVCAGGSNDSNSCTVENSDNGCPGGLCKKKTFFYTNIYVIAYNQNAAPPSINIFDQMLANWKFNKNVMEGKNFFDAEKIKDKLRRDTLRLSDLNGLNKLLNDYKAANGKFPTLPAGTFVKDHSISTWPSWQATLGNALGSALPVDPLNIMSPVLRGTYDCTSSDPNEFNNCQNICSRGANNNALTGCPKNEQCINNDYCSVCPPGYDAQTCWDKTNSRFAFGTFAGCPIGSALASAFNLGGTANACNNDGAFVYQYTALNNGQSYALNYRLEYQAQDLCAAGECVYGNTCYQPGACLDVKDSNNKLIYANTYCYLGSWRSSCGDGFIQSQCGEQCDSSVPPASLDDSWCDLKYGKQDWYNESKIKATCTNSCQVEEFAGLASEPPSYSADPSVLSCGGYCGDNNVQATAGEQCDQGLTISPLKKVEQGGSGGLSQTAQYLCSGLGSSGAPINLNGAACQNFSSWDSATETACPELPDSGTVSKPSGTQNILASGGFKVSYNFTVAQDSNYSFKIIAANSGDNINALTNDQIDFLFTQKKSNPAGVYLYNLNEDGSLTIPEYGNVQNLDPNKYNLLRSLIFSVYVESATSASTTPLGFVTLPAVNADNKQEGTINLGALKAGDYTITLHFVGDHFYVPFAGLALPANLNNFGTVDLNNDQNLDINPLIYSVSLFSPELGVGKCKTFGGYCGDGLVQLQYGEQCDTKNYLTPNSEQTVNLVNNPSFETIFSPWKVLNGTVDLDNNNYFEGRSSVMVNSGGEVSLYQPANLFNQKPYKVSLRLKMITGSLTSVLFQAGDETESDFTQNDQVAVPAVSGQVVDGWQLFQLDSFMPTTSRFKFRLMFVTDPSTSFYIDSVKILPLDNSVRPQYQCGSDQTGKICQYLGGYCGDGLVQSPFGETCDDRVGSSCSASADCGQGTCTSGVCTSKTCNDTCKSTYCGDGIVQKPNSLGVTEICDWGSDPACSFDCQHIKMGGICDADSTSPCPANSTDCRQCSSTLSCTIRNFGDTDKKCLGARGSYGCFTNDDCILGYYCDISTTKCESEISTYLQYHPEGVTSLNLPEPTPNIKYDINNSSCPALQAINAGPADQFITDRCTDINWAATDNISKKSWTYKDALENGCSGVQRLPSILELYSLVSQTNKSDSGMLFSDKSTLGLCALGCEYNENTGACLDCGDQNYLYWSNTCTSKDAQGNCLKAQAINFRYGSIETYNVNTPLKIHCLRDTECGNGTLEQGETCEFYRAFLCQGGSQDGKACKTNADCPGGTCPQKFIEQPIAKKCSDFGYDGGYLHCNLTTCGYKLDNCVLNSQPNQSCEQICQGRKTLACKSVGLNIDKASDQYDLGINPPLMSIANDGKLMSNVNGNCLPQENISCTDVFHDQGANCKDSTTNTIAPFRSQYSYCNCAEKN